MGEPDGLQGLPGKCITMQTSYDKFVVAEPALPFGLGAKVKADRPVASTWEKLGVFKHGDDGVSLKSMMGTEKNSYFLAVERDDQLKADRSVPQAWEKFIVIKNDDGSFSFKTWKNKYLRFGSWWLDGKGQGCCDGQAQPFNERFNVTAC